MYKIAVSKPAGSVAKCYCFVTTPEASWNQFSAPTCGLSFLYGSLRCSECQDITVIVSVSVSLSISVSTFRFIDSECSSDAVLILPVLPFILSTSLITPRYSFNCFLFRVTWNNVQKIQWDKLKYFMHTEWLKQDNDASLIMWFRFFCLSRLHSLYL